MKHEGKQRSGRYFADPDSDEWMDAMLAMCLQKHRRGKHTPRTPSAGRYGLNKMRA